MNEEKDKLELKIDSWVSRMSIGFDNITQTLKRIEVTNEETLEQVLKTNGRVTKIEDEFRTFKEKEYQDFKASTIKDLELFCLIRRKKYLIAIILLAFAQVYDSVNVVSIIKWVTNLFM